MKSMKICQIFMPFIIIFTTVCNAQATEVEVPRGISRDDIVAAMVAKVRWGDATNVFRAGKDIGVLSHCRNINNHTINKAKEDAKIGITLATSQFDFESYSGFRNDRAFNKLVSIFNDGFAEGVRDGRGMKGTRGWRDLCNWLIETWIDGAFKKLPKGFKVK